MGYGNSTFVTDTVVSMYNREEHKFERIVVLDQGEINSNQSYEMQVRKNEQTSRWVEARYLDENTRTPEEQKRNLQQGVQRLIEYGFTDIHFEHLLGRVESFRLLAFIKHVGRNYDIGHNGWCYLRKAGINIGDHCHKRAKYDQDKTAREAGKWKNRLEEIPAPQALIHYADKSLHP
jgi:hypothetical protein